MSGPWLCKDCGGLFVCQSDTCDHPMYTNYPKGYNACYCDKCTPIASKSLGCRIQPASAVAKKRLRGKIIGVHKFQIP